MSMEFLRQIAGWTLYGLKVMGYGCLALLWGSALALGAMGWWYGAPPLRQLGFLLAFTALNMHVLCDAWPWPQCMQWAEQVWTKMRQQRVEDRG